MCKYWASLLPPLDEIMIFWGAFIEKTDRDLRTSDLTPQSGVGVGPAGFGVSFTTQSNRLEEVCVGMH